MEKEIVTRCNDGDFDGAYDLLKIKNTWSFYRFRPWQANGVENADLTLGHWVNTQARVTWAQHRAFCERIA